MLKRGAPQDARLLTLLPQIVPEAASAGSPLGPFFGVPEVFLTVVLQIREDDTGDVLKRY